MANDIYNMQQNNQTILVTAQNLNINLHPQTEMGHNEDVEEESDIENYIFNVNKFSSHSSVVLLRNTIASAITMPPEQAALFGGYTGDVGKIDPLLKNEWFFILAAITDAGILKRTHIKDTDFVKQMVHFFPNLLDINLDNTIEYDKSIRRYVDSISRERSKWKVKGNVVKIVDLRYSKLLLRQLKSDKVERIYSICFPLYQKLQQIGSL